MKNPIRLVAAATLLAFASWAAADSPALVTDLRGRARADQGEISILAPLSAGARLTLAKDARLVVVYLKSGQEFELAGPGAYRVGPAAPEPLGGAEPPRQRALLGAYGPVDTAGKAQAGVVMRSIFLRDLKLSEPSGSRVMTPRPSFRWEAVPGATRYRFRLADNAGAVVAEAFTDAPRFTLPEGISLGEETLYSWSVETRSGQQKYFGQGQFAPIGEGQRQRLETLRPAAGASFSERLLYAAELEDLGLRDEARPLWKRLAAERPDAPRLRELAGE